ncbi:hypothetical protein Tco_0343573 [Tanacetum coccineum]
MILPRALRLLACFPLGQTPHDSHEATKAIVPSPKGLGLAGFQPRITRQQSRPKPPCAETIRVSAWAGFRPRFTWQQSRANNHHVPRPLGSRLGLCSSHTPHDNIPKLQQS